MLPAIATLVALVGFNVAAYVFVRCMRLSMQAEAHVVVRVFAILVMLASLGFPIFEGMVLKDVNDAATRTSMAMGRFSGDAP